MENDIKIKLEEEISSEFDKLKTLGLGSKEHADAVNSLSTLYRLSVEETEKERAFVRNCDRDIMEEREYALKIAQLEEQKKDRWWRLGLEGAGLVLPLAFYAIWMRKGFKFEESGTFTSTTFRGLFNKFKPTKR